ncbi:hypothetical protein QBC43DRAFT_313617 [Cladorrhinum sp. PSN259]|nr:hypothetical protein QBC43DRAFT_313617 [Cladorrhinum sp. PSN259]
MTGPHRLDELDIAECGEFKIYEETLKNRKGSTCVSVTEISSPGDEDVVEEGEQEEDIDSTTGQTGSARRKTFCREWLFFPAGERQFSMVIDYWHAKSAATFNDIVELERGNRQRGREDYKSHWIETDDPEYGEKKEKLMEQLTAQVEKHLTIFGLAKEVMSQHSPHHEYVNDYFQWAYDDNVAPNHFDNALGVNNYRALGPRPSMIDAMIHGMFKRVVHFGVKAKQLLLFGRAAEHQAEASATTSSSATTTTTTTQIYIAPWAYRLISHVFIITIALVFLISPLMLFYLLEMSFRMVVMMTAGFCLIFCVGSIVLFGSLNTDHKFLLLFAYTGVMATLLSNLQGNMMDSSLHVGGGSVVRGSDAASAGGVGVGGG